MKRTGENTIQITDHEMMQIYEFIHRSLDRDWDRHTDNFICEKITKKERNDWIDKCVR